jgi:hypothetical protein
MTDAAVLERAALTAGSSFVSHPRKLISAAIHLTEHVRTYTVGDAKTMSLKQVLLHGQPFASETNSLRPCTDGDPVL